MNAAATAMKVRGVSRTYRDGARTVTALEGTDLDIPEGKFVSIVGPSACGKSTLLNLFCGLDVPDSGSIETPALGVGELLGRVGYMPQQDLLMPWRTVTDNAAVGLECLGCEREEARRQANEHMVRFGLNGFERSFPNQLSDGMRQRVAMLRTFLCGRKLNLLDEPFGKLDAITRASMQTWLLDYWQENRCTIVFVTHDIDEALFLSDVVHLMSPRPGRIILSLEVDVPRPRRYGEVVTSAHFNKLKSRLLASLGKES
ncbi:MAG TPA: ABC transporter ATP-binding protein [Candidatus Acidoferrales bacterium]|nr:ABC transporter ATP-binding protein [Candidatus Acidoferrales bacterium]